MVKWIKQLFKPKVENPGSIYQKEIDILHQLTVDTSVYGEITYIETVIPNIEDYVQVLRQTAHALYGDIVFPRKVFELAMIKRCNFWRNRNGQLIDPTHYCKEFKELAEKILRRHEALLEQKQLTPILEENILRTQTILINMKVVISQL
jgi:hypothetical protein